MSVNAVEAQGTKIRVSADGSPPSFSDIPEVRTIGGPDGSAPTIDVTDLDSTAREYILGLKDEGQIQLGFMYRPANSVHQTLRNAFSNRTLMQFQIDFTDDATRWEFDGYVTGFPISAAVDTVVEGTITIKITGAIAELAQP
jgi:predicted secreted protein